MTSNRLGEYVYRVRMSKSMSMPDIRRRGGPSIGWLGELESGSLASTPKLGTLQKLAKALDCPLSEILEAAGQHPQLIVDNQCRELLDIVRQLPADDYDDMLVLARAKLQRHQKRRGFAAQEER